MPFFKQSAKKNVVLANKKVDLLRLSDDKRNFTPVFMIKTIRHKGLRLLWEGGSGYRLPADQVKRIENMLEVIDSAAEVPADFELYKSWKLHPLKGNFKGYWSLTVKENWRIIFWFDGEDAYELDYIDYH